MATNNTGKRKRASEENDKNGYSTKMGVDTVEENLEEKKRVSSYILPDYDEIYWKHAIASSLSSSSDNNNNNNNNNNNFNMNNNDYDSVTEFLEYRLIGHMCKELEFDTYAEMHRGLRRILVLVEDMRSNKDNMYENVNDVMIRFVKTMVNVDGENLLHKVAVELDGTTGSQARDYKIMGSTLGVTLWSDWCPVLDAIGLFKHVEVNRKQFLKKFADRLKFRELPAKIEFDEGMLNCDCMIIADGLLEYKDETGVEREAKAPFVIGEMNIFFPTNRKEEVLNFKMENQGDLNITLHKPRKFTTKSICRCLYVPRGEFRQLLNGMGKKEKHKVLIASLKSHSKRRNFRDLGTTLGLTTAEINKCIQPASLINGIKKETIKKCKQCAESEYIIDKTNPTKHKCIKCGLVAERTYVLDHTFFPWENCVPSNDNYPRTPPNALHKLCESSLEEIIEIRFGDFLNDYRDIIQWFQTESRRVGGIVDYSMQAKTLEKIIIRVKAVANEVKGAIASSDVGAKVELNRKCKSCGGMDFENDTKKGNRTCKKCGYVDEHNVRGEGPDYRTFTDKHDGTTKNKNHFGPRQNRRRRNMGEVTQPGGPKYLRSIQRKAQSQQEQNDGRNALQITKDEQIRYAQRRIRIVGKQLHINDMTIERGCDLFGYMRDKMQKMQKMDGTICACLIAALRENLGQSTLRKEIKLIESEVELKYINKQNWFSLMQDTKDFSSCFAMKTLLTLKSMTLSCMPELQTSRIWSIINEIPIFIHLKPGMTNTERIKFVSELCSQYNVGNGSNNTTDSNNENCNVLTINVSRNNNNWNIKARASGDLFTMKDHVDNIYHNDDIPTYEWLNQAFTYLYHNVDALKEVGCWWWNLPLLPVSASFELQTSLDRCAMNSDGILKGIHKQLDPNGGKGIIKQKDMIDILLANKIDGMIPETLWTFFVYKYDDERDENKFISYNEFLYYCRHRKQLDKWPYDTNHRLEIKQNYNSYVFEAPQVFNKPGPKVRKLNGKATVSQSSSGNSSGINSGSSNHTVVNVTNARVAQLALKIIETKYQIILSGWKDYANYIKQEEEKHTPDSKLRQQAMHLYKNQIKRFYQWMKTNNKGRQVIINDHVFVYKKCGKVVHEMLQELHQISPDAKKSFIYNLLGHKAVNLRQHIMWSDKPRLIGWQNSVKIPPSPFPKLFPALGNFVKLLRRSVGDESKLEHLLKIKMWKDRSMRFWDKQIKVKVPDNELKSHHTDKKDAIISYVRVEDRSEETGVETHQKERASAGFKKRENLFGSLITK